MLRWGMCVTTLCSFGPWHLLHYHGEGLCQKPNPQRPVHRERRRQAVAGEPLRIGGNVDFFCSVMFLFFLTLSCILS